MMTIDLEGPKYKQFLFTESNNEKQLDWCPIGMHANSWRKVRFGFIIGGPTVGKRNGVHIKTTPFHLVVFP